MLNNGNLFLEKDPISLFKKWMDEAVDKEINDPNAIALSTVDDSGFPNVRMVLLKTSMVKIFYFTLIMVVSNRLKFPVHKSWRLSFIGNLYVGK